MGSSLSKAYEEDERKQAEEDYLWLHLKVKEIEKLKPSTVEFEERKWLEKNKAKIIRNMKLIDLLG